MLVKEWARLEGLHPQTVWKWCRQGTMPVPVEQTPTGMWLIHDPKYETASQPNPADSRTVCYARVSSGGRKGDLQRQADRLKAFAVGHGRRTSRNRHGDRLRREREPEEAQPAARRPDRRHDNRGASRPARPHEHGTRGERVEGAGQTRRRGGRH